MRVTRRRLLLVGIVGLVGIIVLAPWIGRVTLPVVDTVEILGDEIYRIVDTTRRIPARVALPYLARAGGAQFVRRLPLPDPVRDRVLARLDSPGFVHEIVPFVLAVKDMYTSPEAGRADNFDAYLRRNYAAQDKLPGFEHSLFSWTADAANNESDAAGLSLAPDLAAELIAFYDALYLQGRDPAAGLDERLACDPAEIEDRLAATAARSEAALRRLLVRARDGMEPNSELADTVTGVLNDDEAFATIGITVVQFIEQMVCKQYRMFASRIAREDQLARWLAAELEQERGGRLWSYLQATQDTRRYGALIVVDGLQGHLIEALARGDADQAFVRRISEEQRSGERRLAAGPPLEHDLLQQTEFLHRLASEGFTHPAYLPFFRDLYSDNGDIDDALRPWGIALSGVSTTPTISVRNLPVVKTGAPVSGSGATGIPNFHFVDRSFARNGVRQGRAFYFFGNDALQLTSLTAAAGMQSLFERLPERSSYSCTAQYDEWAQDGIDPFFNLAFGEALRDFGETLCFRDLEQRAGNEIRLREYRAELLALRDRLGADVPFYDWYRIWGARAARTRAQQLIRHIAELEGQALPELLVYYNPWPDHFAHFAGPFSDEILAPSGELARLDYWLGRLNELYDKAGVLDRTLFAMAGDHGLSPVFQLESPEARVLEPLRQRGVPIKTIKISSDEGEGPKLTNALEPPSMRGYDVVIASTAGGNLMLDLFIDQSDRWHEQPLESDLRAWRPGAWQLEENDQHPSIDLIQELLTGLGDTLDYLAVRTDPGSPEQSEVRILGPGGRGLLRRRGQRIHYTVTGADLLQTDTMSEYDRWSQTDLRLHAELHDRCMTSPDPGDPTSWCSESDWRRLAAFTPRPDSVVQLAHLYDLDRAGTINLFPAPGVAYNSIVPGRHAGESFHEKDAFAGLWGIPVQRGRMHGRIPVALGGSVPTAIFEYLTGGPITPGSRGWGHPSLWHELYPVAGPESSIPPGPVH